LHVTAPARTANAKTAPGAPIILLITSLGVLIAQIDTSIVNLALKQIGTAFEAGVNTLQWVVDAYNLVYASLLLTAGILADLYGRRRVFVLGILLFAIGSLVCGLAASPSVLIGGRAIAGLGAALEVPTSLALLTVAYPDPRKRAHALGLWASCNGLAFIIGPTLGGVLVDAAGWRSIFLLVIPLCAIVLTLSTGHLPESKDQKGRCLDLPSQALAVVALGGLSLGVIEGPRWGWLSTESAASFALSIIAAVWFFRRQADTDAALVPVPMLKNRTFSACLTVAAAMTFGMYAMLFLVPLYLQSARGASAVLAGLELLPMSVTFVVVSQMSGRTANALGPRIPMSLGMAMMSAGLLMLALLPFADSLSLIEGALLIIGCGLGLNTGPLNAVAVAAVPVTRSGIASGLLNTARMIGATLGVAVLGAVFATFAGSAEFGEGGRMIAGLAPAFIAGAIGEMLGAVAALLFIPSAALDRQSQCPDSEVRPQLASRP
jgi:DHA2 family methylenomycin A resistance protein-like MFS transporter